MEKHSKNNARLVTENHQPVLKTSYISNLPTTFRGDLTIENRCSFGFSPKFGGTLPQLFWETAEGSERVEEDVREAAGCLEND